jgi:PAS domain S-box-containing protein
MYSILYVDDEPDLLEIGRLFLEEGGQFAVETCRSPADALVHLKSVQYDAIVSDYQMPHMDGITFLKKLRTACNMTPFIIFTGRGREEVVIEALNSGADFYLQKGGDPDAQFTELRHKIGHAISRRRADLAIKKSEEDYRCLVEHANEAIYVVEDGYLRMVNPQLSRISGYPEQELLNSPFTLFAHPEDSGMLLDRFRKRINGENVPPRYAFRFLCKDGTIRWAELSVVAITWDGRPATLNFLTDITERKLAGDALRESEERYRQFFRTMRDSVFITTPSGRWVDFNDALVELFGCAGREEVLNAPVGSFYVDPEERAALTGLVERDGYVEDYPVRFRKRDGTVFDALITTVTLKNPDGSTKGYIGTIRDITGRKRTENALRESEERYRQFFRTSLDSVFITTPEGRFIDFNTGTMKQIGASSREEISGMNAISSWARPEERAAFLERVRKEGYVREHPIRFRRLNGEIFDALISIVPLKNPDGSARAFLGTVRDLTEIRSSILRG